MSTSNVRLNKEASNHFVTPREKNEIPEKLTSRKETAMEYHISLSTEEYSRIVRRALQKGCSVEELIAQRIEQMIHEGEMCDSSPSGAHAIP